MTKTVEEMAFALLGGKALSRHNVRCSLEAHDMIVDRIRVDAALHMIENVNILSSDVIITKAIGVSRRTLQRKKSAHLEARLSLHQSSRVWQLAETLSYATNVFKDRKTAEGWFLEPLHVSHHRLPIDLVCTSAGLSEIARILRCIDARVYIRQVGVGTVLNN